MKRKIYISNILRHWPPDDQRAALATVPRPVETYEDVLKPQALRSHSPASLKDRAELLRATARKRGDEMIHVASLGVLAWAAEDFMTALAAAAHRGAAVSVQETGRVIPPAASAGELAEAMSEFLAARRRHQATGARLAGVEASKAARMADAKRRADLIEDDWHRAEMATDVLLERAGKVRRGRLVPMAWRTAVNLLGRRPTQRQFDKSKERADA